MISRLNRNQQSLYCLDYGFETVVEPFGNFSKKGSNYDCSQKREKKFNSNYTSIIRDTLRDDDSQLETERPSLFFSTSHRKDNLMNCYPNENELYRSK